MIGAIVFLVVFAISAFVTFSSPTIPPGLSIYYALGFPTTTYPILGYPAPTFAAGIFNGIVFGVIAWIIYSIISAATKKSKKTTVVYTQAPPPPPS